MPGLHLHRMLAQRMLDHWDGEGINELNHYRPHCSDSRNAFFAGAFGPDLGYFPGGHRLISDLAHRVRSGQLVRHLLTTAATPIERCFAAGWLTHVVGDLPIHPAIPREVGELVNGDRTRPLGGGSHPAEHVRVETGLDAWWAAEEPGPVSAGMGLPGSVCVVIPTLNEEDSISATIDALKAQSAPPEQIVIADAGSTDRTTGIGRALGCRIVAGGLPGVGRNNGARATDSAWILFLDADVLVPPDGRIT